MFEQEGGIDKLEALQMHPNHQIYDRVIKLIESYFSEENEELDINNATAETDDGNTFKF
jgi:Atypical Arm repeat